MPVRPRTWVELSASAVRHNLRVTQRRVGRQVRIIPIIKANAYGHGVQEIVRALPSSVHQVGVAYGEEALALRANGYRGNIIVLSFWRAEELPQLIQKQCELVVWNEESLRALERLTPKFRRLTRIHVKLDTGTSRIGFTTLTPTHVRRLSAFHIAGMFSHFSNAEDREQHVTDHQLKRFATLSATVPFEWGSIRHIACTAAALRAPEAKFEAVRLGIGLYGLWPSQATRSEIRAKFRWYDLQPVLTWKSVLAQVKTVSAGTSIGYGRSVTVHRPTVVGTIPVGYADGYDRRLSNRGWVMIRGHRAPILGRICMNLLMVDLTRVPRPRVGGVVTLLGQDMTADTMADLCGTINYEITTRINWSIPRLLTR